MRALPLFALLCLGACAEGGTAPDLQLSVMLADGRGCRDAGVSTIGLRFGAEVPLRYLCNEVVAPRTVTASQLPLADSIEVIGFSAQDGELYRGTFVPAEVVGTGATVTLYPSAAR